MARRRGITTVLTLVSLFLAACTATGGGSRVEITPIDELITRTWQAYSQRFIDPDGRVYRPLNDGDTVSEGQAYALLIASLLDDRQTFDKVMRWTRRHLSRYERTGDHLLAWHWEADKGVIDWNSASDADIDYALALLIASSRWHDQRYTQKARLILRDLLDLETEVVNGRRYLLPGNWRQANSRYVVNPSYLSPAHFRVFFICTGDSRWNDLIDSSYHLIDTVSQDFAGIAGVGLVPDWLRIAPDGTLTHAEGFSDRFGWDAIRTQWRLGMDALWFGEDRAGRYLATLSDFYAKEWERSGGRFFAEYSYDGRPTVEYEHVATYAMSLSALATSNSPILEGVLDKLRRRFNGTAQLFEETDDYYANSLALLGLIFHREARTPTIDLQQLDCR